MLLEADVARVMVVDDELMVRQFVMSVLSSSGYHVSDAESPAQALRLMDANPDLDLLVTDVVMPGGNGWDLADVMRSRKPDLPVLFISGYEPPNGRTVPKASFLQKPFRIPELLERVRLMLDSESTSCSSTPPATGGKQNPRTSS
jgi:DNA-binding response OmpR family regulator